MVDATIPDSEFLTPAEAARFIHRSKSSLAQRRWLKQGPAYHRCGRKILYRRKDLELFIAEGRVEPGQSQA